MAKRKMSALQRKYFGKGHGVHHKRKRVSAARVHKRRYVMARRKGGYRRTVSRGIGGMKSFLPPILSGVADSYLDPMLPIDGIGATAVGMFMHNETMKNLGLYKVGFSIGNIIPLPGRSVSQSSGGFI